MQVLRRTVLRRVSFVDLEQHWAKEQVENLMIPVPPKSLQEKFAAIKAKVKSVGITENTVINLRLFESLSQKAFAGEL